MCGVLFPQGYGLHLQFDVDCAGSCGRALDLLRGKGREGKGRGYVNKQDTLRNVLPLIEIIHGNLVPSGRLKLRKEVFVWCEWN
jgi:hypothetical protein